MWRLRETTPTATIKYLGGNVKHKLGKVRAAIMYEVGCDERTITKYIHILIELKQLRRINRWDFEDIGEFI